MDKFYVRGVIAWLSLLFVAVTAISCVNEKYDMSGDKVNLEVTPFREGLAVPLGKTGQIKLGDLLNGVSPDLLQSYENGAYFINFNDSFDLTEELADLNGMVEIPDVEMSRDVKFRISGMDVSNIKVDAQKFPYEYPLSSSIKAPDVTVPPVNEDVYESAGLYEYAPSEEDLRIELSNIERNQKICSLSKELQDNIASGPLSDIPIAVVGGAYSEHITKSTSFESSLTYDMEVSFDKGIRSVKELVMSEDAEIRITLSVNRAFIHSGNIIPDINLDFSQLFHLEGGKDVVNLKDVMTLSADDYSATASYKIRSLAVNPEDWTSTENGLVLNKQFKASIDGQVSIDELMTTTRLLADPANANMFLDFKVEFLNIEVSDVVMDVELTDLKMEREVNLAVEEVKLPESVKEIKDVVFTKNSGIDLMIQAVNMENMPELNIDLTTLEINFPKSVHVEGANEHNQVIYNGVDLREGMRKHIRITSVDFPEAVDGMLSLNEMVVVKSYIAAAGTVHSKDIPMTEEDDLKIHYSVDSDIEIADYKIMLSGYEHELNIDAQQVKIEIPSEFAGQSEIVVYPEGDAYIAMEINIPDVGLNVVPAEEGISVAFPEMLSFKALPSSYNFDLKTNSVNLTEPLSTYGKITLPIEKLVLTPELDPSDNKYYAQGDVQITGGIAIEDGWLTKAQIEEMADTESPKKIEVLLEISDFTPKSLDMGTFETGIRENVEFNLLSAGSLPEELVAVNDVELKDTYINMWLDASELPELGEATLSVDFKLDFPDIIRIPAVDENGFVSRSAVLEDGKLVFEPLEVSGLNLADVDLSEGVKGVVVIDGTVRLSDASVDINQLAGKDLKATINVDISDIDIARVSGKVDYSLEPVEETLDLSDLTGKIADSGAEAVLDFNRAYLVLEILSNLSIPVEASVELIPYYNGSADMDKVITADLALELAENSSQEAATRLWLANNDENCPAGYTFVEADILGLLRDVPEKLELKLNAGTDVEREAVLEPSAEYTLKANYRFELPLEFGEEFDVTYKTVISDLPEIVGTVLKSGNKLMLGGEIENLLPLALELKMNLLDSDGNLIPLAEGSGHQKIAPCSLEGKPVKTELGVLVGLENGTELDEVKSLELLFEANSAGVVGVPVTKDAYLQAVIQAVLPEGITVDLTEFLNEEE